MTKTEKLAKLDLIFNSEINVDILNLYLDIATEKVLDRLYPFERLTDTTPIRYEYIELEIAIYLINKRGAEGQIAHSEGGINRKYQSADIPSSMLDNIIPFAEVL